jgi:cbb3-type cytochrome oxidase subunit 3
LLLIRARCELSLLPDFFKIAFAFLISAFVIVLILSCFVVCCLLFVYRDVNKKQARQHAVFITALVCKHLIMFAIAI